MRMLARVEGMPLDVARERACRGTGRTSGEYLDRIDGTLGVNAGFMVGHSAIRRVVMGEECVGSAATADETSTAMCKRCCAPASQPVGSASRRRGRADLAHVPHRRRVPIRAGRPRLPRPRHHRCSRRQPRRERHRSRRHSVSQPCRLRAHRRLCSRRRCRARRLHLIRAAQLHRSTLAACSRSGESGGLQRRAKRPRREHRASRPSPTARGSLEQNRQGEQVRRAVRCGGPSLGITVEDLNDQCGPSMAFASTACALVMAVKPGSPAEAVGIKPGNLVVRMNLRQIGSANDLVNAIATAPQDRDSEIQYYEGGRLSSKLVRLTPGAGVRPLLAPPHTVARATSCSRGLAVASIRSRLRQRVGRAGGAIPGIMNRIRSGVGGAGTGNSPLLQQIEEAAGQLTRPTGTSTVYNPVAFAALQMRVVELTDQVKELQEHVEHARRETWHFVASRRPNGWHSRRRTIGRRHFRQAEREPARHERRPASAEAPLRRQRPALGRSNRCYRETSLTGEGEAPAEPQYRPAQGSAGASPSRGLRDSPRLALTIADNLSAIVSGRALVQPSRASRLHRHAANRARLLPWPRRPSAQASAEP